MHWFLHPGRGGFRGAYDAFAGSIVHAYVPARRVLSSYVGSLCRIRRASDNAELNFGYDAQGNLDTAAIAAWLAGANGYVVRVYDQAPADDTISQAVAGFQPLYVASAKNGHAGIWFDGADDYLQGAYTTGGALSQPVTIMAVAQLDATVVDDGNHRCLCDADDATYMHLQKNSVPNPDGWDIYAGADLVNGAADSNWNVWAALLNGASSQFWHNGASKAAGNAGTNNPDGITIGALNDGSRNWRGYITSFIVADPAFVDAERMAMQTIMNKYWACY